MRYLLPEYDRGAFNSVDDLVRMCYHNPLNGLWGYPWHSLGQISTTHNGLKLENVQYIKSNNGPGNQLNGVCFHDGTDFFKIWLNPSLEPHSVLFELTLIHELCHGYLGSKKMHNAEWRAYYGKAVILYSQLINLNLRDVEWQIKHTIRRYRSEELPDESFADYSLNCELELEAILRAVNDNIVNIERDFLKLKEMRNGCHASTSVTTPTPAYLASLPRKVGTGFPLK
jgi:hypothetical protein